MLTPVKLPPGLERNNTPYETTDRYWDSNLVRWQSGSITPVGGWTKLTATPLTGAIRKIFVYRDNSDQRHTLVGTDSNLYEDNGSSYTDITPAAFVPLNTIGTGRWLRHVDLWVLYLWHAALGPLSDLLALRLLDDG